MEEEKRMLSQKSFRKEQTMKKIIGILLVVVLIAAGLGGLAYAVDSVNQVHIGFATNWQYNVPGDVFSN